MENLFFHSSGKQQPSKQAVTRSFERHRFVTSIQREIMMTDEIAASNGTNFTENNFSRRESTGNVGEDEENWLYERPRTGENNPTETIDDANEQEEIEPQTNPTMSSASNIDQLDDDSDDDDDNIQVTIGDIRTAPPMFPGRQLSRQSNPGETKKKQNEIIFENFV